MYVGRKSGHFMQQEPANRYWLQNNNMPPRQSNQMRPGPAGGPNGQPPRRGLSVNRWLLIIVLVMLGIYLYQFLSANNNSANQPQVDQLSYSDFMKQISAGNIKSATIIGSTDITGSFCTSVGQYTGYHVLQLPFTDPNLLSMLNDPSSTKFVKPTCQAQTTVITQAPADNSFWLNILITFLPWIFLILLFVFISRRATQSQQNIFNFGRSRAKLIMEDRPTTTFADIAGVDEAKAELEEVVEFLKTPQKFQRLGGKIPKGVLLVGPPGTGKTLLARAVAGEAGVPFYSMSGSEFVEVLVGVGASRVRDLFDQAKKAAPSIIFIDEIDAVGRQRGTSLTTNDEREQTLNQLLVEMDGFDARQAVVVVAATNRPDGLDQALLRPGRFDRRVTVDRPDWKGRQAILMIHSRGVPLAPDVDLQQLARTTTGMVGADLANLVNEAALLAARRNLDRVNMACFNDALDRIQIGAERPLVLTEADLQVVAVHEAGHALIGLLTPHSDPVTKVTIVPRGQALGVTQYTPLDDRYNYSREYLFGLLMTALGGRAAEEVSLGSITSGAENDLQKVTQIAHTMVARLGMSTRLGLISFSDRTSPFIGGGELGQRDYSDATAALIDEETRDLVQQAYQQVKQMLTEHKVTLERIAGELRKHETLDAKQLSQILIETGISLAEVAPIPNAETVGLRPPAGEIDAPAAPNGANGTNGTNGAGTPTPRSFPDGFGPFSN